MSMLGCMFVVATVGELPTAGPTVEEVRGAIQRSLPYIGEKGAWWIERKECVSCHRVNTMVWSLTAARKSGFDVGDELDEWRTWAVEASLAENDKGKIVGLGNKEGVAQLLLGLDVAGERDESGRALAALLPNDQRADGSWKPGGQLPSQKRAEAETASVSTMWITLALMAGNPREETAAVLKRALDAVAQSSPGKSTEWYAVRLLLAARQDDRGVLEDMQRTLRTQQADDGGWGWLVGEKSDALGTGLALYALAATGVSREDAAIQRAQRFLVSTQRDDGSWAVKGTKAKKQDAVRETSTYWGTTWATLGLLASLPTGTPHE